MHALFHGEWSVNVLPVDIKVSFTRCAIIGSVVVPPVQIRLHLVQGPFVCRMVLFVVSVIFWEVLYQLYYIYQYSLWYTNTTKRGVNKVNTSQLFCELTDKPLLRCHK